MKILLNEKEKNKCFKLIEAKENNIESVEYLIDFLFNHCRDISFAANPQDWFEQFNKIEQIEKNVISNSTMNIIHILDEKEFLNDEYYKIIGQIKAQNNDWQFMTLEYAPFEGFVYDEIEVDDQFFKEHTPVGYFKNEFKYLAVLQNDEIWMSIMPHEINTMKDPIKNAHGNVLVLGLGLGYYLFNILSKKEVTSVTVIENDRQIISLFNKYLLPKFPHQEKINIVFDDAIKYTKNKHNYDYCFADIWHNVGDGEMLYLKLKANEKFNPQTQYDYWIEKSMLAMLRRQTIGMFQEQLEGVEESLYYKAKNDNDKIINAIYFYLKDKQIKTFNDFHDFLTDESLKVMATKLF